MPSFRATAMFDSPLAQLRTMRDRNANPCALLRRAVQRSSVARSSALTLSSVFGRPVIHIPRLQLMSPDVCYIESLGRDTSVALLIVARRAVVRPTTRVRDLGLLACLAALAALALAVGFSRGNGLAPRYATLAAAVVYVVYMAVSASTGSIATAVRWILFARLVATVPIN